MLIKFLIIIISLIFIIWTMLRIVSISENRHYKA